MNLPVSRGWDLGQEDGPGQSPILQEATPLGKSHFLPTLDLLASQVWDLFVKSQCILGQSPQEPPWEERPVGQY